MAFCGQCGTPSSGGAFCTECGASTGGATAVESVSATPTPVYEPTTFEHKCDILAELWVNYKNDVEFEDFIAYNDLGLPLAYAVSADIAETNPKIEGFINDTFALLLTGLEREDEGFTDLSDILA